MSDQFYESLLVHSGPVGELILRNELFLPVPANWEIVVTDIRQSTVAVEKGRHKEVNLIATGSIVCVLNIAYKHGIVIPFFFGGDGATFLIPPSLLTEALENLTVYRGQVAENFELLLRIGNISVAEVYAAEQKLRIAKYSNSPKLIIPLIIGNGLGYAEELIKRADTTPSIKGRTTSEVNLSGLQCRWDQIAPPVYNNEVVTLLVVAVDGNDQGPAFSKVLNELDRLYGFPQKRQPISESKLKINFSLRDAGTSMLVKLGDRTWYKVLREWFMIVYGYFYFRTLNGKAYLKTLVEMSDTFVLDGRINTVISGSRKQREDLIIFLTNLEKQGDIYYGVHISQASVMSCYVPDQMQRHVHFVDGLGGGYTQAARMLKAKLHI